MENITEIIRAELTDTSTEAADLPHDEPRQIVCTGEAGSDQWNAAFGTWEVDEFGMESDETVGEGERLFVNRRLYDSLAAESDTLAKQVEDMGESYSKLADDYLKCAERYQETVTLYSGTVEELAKVRRDREAIAAQLAETRASLYALEKGIWRDGCPDRISGSEWFIALIEGGRRVVLKALPNEHSYDYTTADETYLAAHKIHRWMQFPDAHFTAPDTTVHTTVERIEHIKAEARNAALDEAEDKVSANCCAMPGNHIARSYNAGVSDSLAEIRALAQKDGVSKPKV